MHNSCIIIMISFSIFLFDNYFLYWIYTFLTHSQCTAKYQNVEFVIIETIIND